MEQEDPDFGLSHETGVTRGARHARRPARAPAPAREPSNPRSPTPSPSPPKTKRGGKAENARQAMPPPAVFTRPKTRGAAAAATATGGTSNPRVLTVKRSPPKDSKEKVEAERTARATPAQRTSAVNNSVVPRTVPLPSDVLAPITSAPPLPIDAGAMMLQVPLDPTAAAIAELRAQVAALTTHATSLESRLNEKDAQIAALSAALTATPRAIVPALGRPLSAAATTEALRSMDSQLRTLVMSHNKHASSLENHAAEIMLLQGAVRRVGADVAVALNAQRQDAHGRMTVDAALNRCWEGIKNLEMKLIDVKIEVMEEVRKVGEVAYTGARASWPWGGFQLPTPAEEEKKEI